MSSPANRVTQPAEVISEALVHNIYTDSAGAPDRQSQEDFSQYLVDRMYGVEDEVARKYVPGIEIPRAKLTFEGWYIRPKTAAVLSAIALLAVNAAVNAKSIVGKVEETGGDLINMVQPKQRIVAGTQARKKSITKVDTSRIDETGKEQRSGIAQTDKLSAGEFVTKLKAIRKNGKIEKILIDGGASDEWFQHGVKSVGRADSSNIELSMKRAEKFRDSVIANAKQQGLSLPTISVRAHENVLGHDKLGTFLADVQQSKYSSVLSAIRAYNRGDKNMSDHLRSEIQHLIGSQRVGTAAVTVTETLTIPGTLTSTNPHKENISRKDEKHPHHIIPILIPAIPRFRRFYTDPFIRPPVIIEKPLDKVWIELYEEALQKNGELVRDAWSLSRKYQALYREERITQALRFDYQDDKGEAQTIKVLFTDRAELDEETINAISGLMFDISMMQAGTVADKLDTIVIVPTESTGPQRPDKIGLGIDEQYHENILGVAIPVIGLVEMQLPLSPTQNDIDRFNGMRWVLAHEVAGHFTDVNTEARFIDKARSDRPGRTFTARDPWARAGDDGYASTARRGSIHVQQFTILHPDGGAGEYIVNPGDKQLADSATTRLRGQAPTSYGDSSAAELHAETAAAVVTNIPIPAQQAGLKSKTLGPKASYRVDAGLQHRFVSRIGASKNTEDLHWDDSKITERKKSFSVRVMTGTVRLNTDSDERRISETAKNQPYQADSKRLKILARARR